MTLQRLVFFRFLVIAIAQERRKLGGGHQSPGEHRSKRDTLASAGRRKTLLDALRRHQDAEAVKPRKRKVKLKRRRSSVVVEDADGTEKQHSSSDQETADPRADEEDQKKTTDNEGCTLPSGENGVERAADDASSRALVMEWNKRLADAMEKLGLVIASLSSQQTPVHQPFTVIKATHVAAAAFHQRINTMVRQFRLALLRHLSD